jgi:hypothetical protein
VGWLRVAGAAIELRELAAELATRVAEHRDTPEAKGIAVWGGMHVMVTAGGIDLARVELDSVSVPTRTSEGMQLGGVLTLCRSFLAVADSRPGDLDAPLEYAAELARRTGQGNAYGLGFGPQEVGQWRVLTVLEAGDPERAVHLAESLQPGPAHPIRTRRTQNLITYGRALARLRLRREDAVMAFRRAELILPQYVPRDPISREILAGLIGRVRRDSPVGRELHGMAYRAGLPV